MLDQFIIDQMRSLLGVAGREWPGIIQQHDEGSCFECPMCGGEGIIDSEFVSEGRRNGPNLTLTGVQVFGIGEQMLALSSLMPLVMEHLPAILDRVAELEVGYTRTLNQIAAMCGSPDAEQACRNILQVVKEAGNA